MPGESERLPTPADLPYELPLTSQLLRYHESRDCDNLFTCSSTPKSQGHGPGSRQANLEKPDNISRSCELVLLRAVLIRGIIVGALESELGTKENSGSNPVSPADEVLRVPRLGACPLAHPVIEILVANGQVIVFPDLFFQVVDDGPVRGIASDRGRVLTKRSLRI